MQIINDEKYTSGRNVARTMIDKWVWEFRLNEAKLRAKRILVDYTHIVGECKGSVDCSYFAGVVHELEEFIN